MNLLFALHQTCGRRISRVCRKDRPCPSSEVCFRLWWLMSTFSTLIILILSGIHVQALAQPIWEDINPLPGHDVVFVTERITSTSGIWCVVCMDSGDCWSQNYRPFYSSDGGDTWEMRDNGIDGFGDLGVRIVDINPCNPDLLLAKSAGPQIPPYRSTDRGLTWESIDTIPNLPPNGSIMFAAGWFPDGVHAYAYNITPETDHSYWLSGDTAHTWEYLGELNDSHLYPFFMDGRIPGLIVNSGLQISISLGFGHSWETSVHFPFYDIRFGGPGTLPGQIYGTVHFIDGDFPDYTRYRVPCFSADTGRTWDFLNPADTLRWPIPGRAAPRIFPDSSMAGHLFFMRTDSVFESWDDGQAWQLLWAGPEDEHQLHLMGYAPEWDRLYVVATDEQITSPYPPGLWRMTRGESVNDPDRIQLPIILRLSSYPNPFNSTVSIQYVLDHQQHITLDVYTISGRHVCRLAEGSQMPGYHTVLFDGASLASGIYLSRLHAGMTMETKKIVLLR